MAAAAPVTLASTVHLTLDIMPKPLREIIIGYATPLFEHSIPLVRVMNEINSKLNELDFDIDPVPEEIIEQIQVLFSYFLEEGYIEKMIPRESLSTPAKLKKIVIHKSNSVKAINKFKVLLKGDPSRALTPDDYVEIIKRVRVIGLIWHTLGWHAHAVRLLGFEMPDLVARVEHVFLVYKALRKEIEDRFTLQMKFVECGEISEQNLAWLETGPSGSPLKLLGCKTRITLGIERHSWIDIEM